MIIKVIIISVICKKKITYFIYHLSFIKRSPLRWGKGLILSFKRQVIGTGCTAKFMFFSPKNAKLLPSLPLASTELLLFVIEIDRPKEVTVHSGLFQGWAALPQSGEGLQFTWKHNFPSSLFPTLSWLPFLTAPLTRALGWHWQGRRHWWQGGRGCCSPWRGAPSASSPAAHTT